MRASVKEGYKSLMRLASLMPAEGPEARDHLMSMIRQVFRRPGNLSDGADGLNVHEMLCTALVGRRKRRKEKESEVSHFA
mmetsp:Transcript_7907/g.12565  ORF Transcript_7907/g.12565 Transcript_7907/m.12565 type:complete len:80 (-) Transcript_7907:192-431(-)